MNRAASIALTPLSVIYAGLIKSGNALYRRKVFRAHLVPEPVISVGNLTTGGTGKTPLVEWIARELAEAGRRVCVLTRGYRRESTGRVVVCDGNEIRADLGQAGDEPLLLAENLRGKAAVICDADRVSAAEWAIDNLKVDAFVLDDGFQHQRIARDLNIVTIDATNPWGNGRLLPAGILREPRAALSRSDCVVITRADDLQAVDKLRKEIRKLSPQAALFTCRNRLSGLRQLGPPEIATAPTTIQNLPLAAFCAIGNPGSFFSLLRQNGYQLKNEDTFRDHHKYTQPDVDRLVARARTAGAQALLTSSKDAVKLRAFNFSLPAYVVEVDLEIDNVDELRELILKVVRQS